MKPRITDTTDDLIIIVPPRTIHEPTLDTDRKLARKAYQEQIAMSQTANRMTHFTTRDGDRCTLHANPPLVEGEGNVIGAVVVCSAIMLAAVVVVACLVT